MYSVATFTFFGPQSVTRVFTLFHAPCVLRFLGVTEFAPGAWAGVELADRGQGKNNGSVNGKEYFKCSDNRGIFVRASQLQVTI